MNMYILDRREVVEQYGEHGDNILVKGRMWAAPVHKSRLLRCITIEITEDGAATEVNTITNPRMGVRHLNYESTLRHLPYTFDINLGKYIINKGERYYAFEDNGTFILVAPAT